SRVSRLFPIENCARLVQRVGASELIAQQHNRKLMGGLFEERLAVVLVANQVRAVKNRRYAHYSALRLGSGGHGAGTQERSCGIALAATVGWRRQAPPVRLANGLVDDSADAGEEFEHLAQSLHSPATAVEIECSADDAALLGFIPALIPIDGQPGSEPS